MGKKNFQSDRRRFLTGAGLLLASTGIASITRNEILKKVASELFPMAHAATPSQHVDFFIELLGRPGVPLIYLGTGQAFTQGNGAQFPNAAIRNVADLRLATGTQNANGLFMNGVTGGASGSVFGLLGPHAANIAISQGIDANGLPHSTLFAHREGDKGMGMVTPIIEFADRAKGNTAFYENLVVHGVGWYQGGNAINVTNGRQDLNAVGSPNDFQNLFREPVLRLSRSEVAAVAEASKRLSNEQARNLASRIKDVENVAAAQNKGADLLTRDYSPLLAIDGLPNNGPQGVEGWTAPNQNVGAAMSHTVKAFEHGLISSATITFNTNDWHGFQSNGSGQTMSMQEQSALYLANIFSRIITFLKNTPHPYRSGESLWDRTMIQMSSEFTRGISTLNSDNSDGGTQGFLLMGGQVKGGYYGAFDLARAGNTDRVCGFDPVTGAPLGWLGNTANKNGSNELYNTVNMFLGNQSNAGGRVLTCLKA